MTLDPKAIESAVTGFDPMSDARYATLLRAVQNGYASPRPAYEAGVRDGVEAAVAALQASLQEEAEAAAAKPAPDGAAILEGARAWRTRVEDSLTRIEDSQARTGQAMLTAYQACLAEVAKLTAERRDDFDYRATALMAACKLYAGGPIFASSERVSQTTRTFERLLRGE